MSAPEDRVEFGINCKTQMMSRLLRDHYFLDEFAQEVLPILQQLYFRIAIMHVINRRVGQLQIFHI